MNIRVTVVFGVVGMSLTIGLAFAQPVSSKGPENTEKNLALMIAVIRGSLENVQSLLNSGADVNAKLKDGSTPIVLAALWRQTDMVRLLRAHGAEITLFVAALLDDDKEARSLINGGADVNEKFEMGRTPLMGAAIMGNSKMVKLLLDRGADVNAKDNSGDTVLTSTCTVDLLRQREKGTEGAEVYEEVVNSLLEKGAEVDAKNKLRGLIAFTWAVARSRLDVVRSLLDKGADVSADPSLLQGAVDSGNLEIVRLVLDKGADVNAIPVGFGRSTALSRAASKGHLEIARLLLDKGAEVNESAEGGFTALMEAAGEGDPQMVELLLDKGADVNTKATDNVSTALNKARRHGQKKIEEILTAHGAKE